LLVLLVCLSAPAAFAMQQNDRTISGTVTDRHREPLAGAVVMVHSESTLSIVSYITDRDGHYVFMHLSPDDDFRIFATYRGVRSKSRHFGKFDSKPNREFHLVVNLH
jgi:hypothetical protein